MSVVDTDLIEKRLKKLDAVGKRTSFGLTQSWETTSVRSKAYKTAKKLGIKVSTHKDAKKSTLVVTRTA